MVAVESGFLDIVRSVKTGHEALAVWSKLEAAQRFERLDKIVSCLEESKSKVLSSLHDELGAPISQSRDFDLAVGATKKILAKVRSQNETFGGPIPVGLVGVITGSKNPVSSVMQRLVSCLAVGNAVIWKPSSKLTETSKVILEVFNRANIPIGLINPVFGESATTSSIIQHPAIHNILFSGSTEVGQLVYKEAGEYSKKVQLSMGARNSAIIFADINLDKIIPKLAESFFDYHGLGRLRASRIFVQESFYKSFLEALKDYLAKSNLNYLGSLANNEDAKRFIAAKNQAIKEQGKSLLPEGEERPGLNPVVIFDLTNCSTLQQEEIHGPMITVASFKYQFDAIKYANTSPLGKAAYVWSNDLDKARKVAGKIEAGRIFVNDLPKLEIPDHYTSLKNSGFGGEGIRDIIDFVAYQSTIEE